MPKSSIASRRPRSCSSAMIGSDSAMVLHHRRLGQLDHHAVRREAERLDRLEHLAHRGRLPEHRRQVDRHVQVEPHVAPHCALPAGLVDDPFRDRGDHAGALGQRDELVGHDQAALAVAPPDQRLDADHVVGREVDQRLVVEHELLALDRPPQASGHRQPRHRVAACRAGTAGGRRARAPSPGTSRCRRA